MINAEVDDSMHRYYEKRAPEYDDWYERRGRYADPATNAAWFGELSDLNRNLTRLAATVSHKNEVRILDLACGTGRWTPIFGRALNAHGRVIAMDYSAAMLGQTRAGLEDDEQNQDLLTRTLFVRGDAYTLPFKDGTFDVVFFGFWLSHVPTARLDAFFREVKRVLKPGGQVFIVDSAQETDRPDQEISQRPLNDGSVYAVLKIRYNPGDLQTLLERYFGSGHASVKQTPRYFVMAVAQQPLA